MSHSIGQVATYKPLSRLGMEELAARQLTIKASGGIEFARNGDGEEKQKARNLIVDMLASKEWDRPLNMLTMPGVRWQFERQLLARRQPGWLKHRFPNMTHFTGVENDRAIYFASVTQMPGTETPSRLIKPVKRERFPFAEMAVKTRYVSFFFANVDELMQHKFEPPPYREESYRPGWDVAWLDYTGPLSRSRLAIIANFYREYIKETLIVTALKARWDRDTVAAITQAGGHSEWLRKALPGDVLHDIEYIDTSPMIQFAVRKA